MKIMEGDMEEIKNLLQNSWHAGHRWVVYEDGESITAKSMLGAKNITTANIYCENRNTDGYLFKFKAITSVLKTIFESEGRLAVATPNARRLEMEIKRLSIVPTSWDDDLVKSLQYGEIYPVIRQRLIDPQNEIGRYKILTQHDGPQTISSVAEGMPTEIASYRDYQQATEHFQRMGKVDAGGTHEHPSVFFIGEYKGHKLVMGNDGFPEKNTGLLLSMWRSLPEFGHPIKSYCPIAVNDPKSPAVINEPALAQYNSHTNKVNLLDGHLKSVASGKLIPYMEVDHFGFKSPIAVVPGPVQALWQEQKDVQALQATFRNRPQ